MIKLLICDDDKKVVCDLLKLISTFETKNKISFDIDTKSSGDFILDNQKIYDIAIVDIEMPGINGLTLSKILKCNNDDIIVMILTSFQNYLDDAMKIHVFRYLSKPLDKNRFFSNFSDAINEYRNINKNITLCINDQVHLIKTKDILFIENLKYGSKIVTKQGSFITSIKPKQWQEKINQNNCFVFSHNSILVNLQNVIDFNKKEVTLKDKNNIVKTYMSQRKYSNFKKSFFDFAGGIK